jgi:uncharacterized protein (DUF1697 family)
MNTYVAVLRGINVGGQRIIAMKDLKALFIKKGFGNVMTYIQSGNVVFESSESDTKKLKKHIIALIQNHYNFSVPVLVLSHENMLEILEKNPYIDREQDTNKLHVTLLEKIPDEKLLASCYDEKFQSDEFTIKDTTIYLYCPDGYGMTRFSTTFFEKKL